MRKKPQYTKIVVSITTILFILVLLASFSFMFYITLSGPNSFVDYAVPTTSITVMGSIYAIILKGYMSKSGLENVANIRKSVYKEIMDTRLEYDEKVLRLKRMYGVDQYMIDDIENNAPFKNLSDMVVSQTTNKLDQVDSVNESEPNEY